jgi:NADPH-dependent glutamate synthase beta subunit-like oxidoreductase
MSAEAGSRHAVAVIGGATAGAEVAGRLAARGVEAVVFEQNDRPYGKIEDGLPRWHVHLRKKEYGLIDQRLDRPGVHFVPRTKIGRDIPFEDLASRWGFTVVVLAVGAWRDRPLPVPDTDRFVGRGLIYQNPFIYWFNHFVEKDYRGPVYEALDDTIVVGGGLASIDVVKALQLETTRQALAERGIAEEMLKLEVRGIPDVLASHGLTWEDLGLRGCTLYYRRRPEDMPLVEAPEGADAARLAKVAGGRKKILEKAMRKYLLRMASRLAPQAPIVEGDRLAGLVFRRTRIEEGRIAGVTDETVEARGSMVVSSIGSVPEPLEGIPMKGDLFQFTDWKLGRLERYDHVFSAGNVVTGKGNIVASRKHGVEIATHVVERFLGLGEEAHTGEEAMAGPGRAAAREFADAVAREVAGRPRLDPPALARLRAKVRAAQEAAGYAGDYAAWIRQVTPPDRV